jgi:hypothetical protein
VSQAKRERFEWLAGEGCVPQRLGHHGATEDTEGKDKNIKGLWLFGLRRRDAMRWFAFPDHTCEDYESRSE